MITWVLKSRLPFQESLVCMPVWRSRPDLRISEFTPDSTTPGEYALCAPAREWSGRRRFSHVSHVPCQRALTALRDRPGPAQWCVLGFCCSGRERHKLSQSSDLRMCASSLSKLKSILLECYFCLMEEGKKKKTFNHSSSVSSHFDITALAPHMWATIYLKQHKHTVGLRNKWMS